MHGVGVRRTWRGREEDVGRIHVGSVAAYPCMAATHSAPAASALTSIDVERSNRTKAEIAPCCGTSV